MDNKLDTYQTQIDNTFKESLKRIGTSLKKDSDWNTKFTLALSYASKVQILVDHTSYVDENAQILSYGYMLENYFLNQQKVTLDDNSNDFDEFITCVEVLSTNPSDKQYANKLISLLSK